jgi:hypothetical protein
MAAGRQARHLGNESPKNINDPKDPEVVWLSRGLLEACLNYINGTKPGEALRVAAYEFTYPPILDALKAVIDKGIDVKIVYHDTSNAKGKPNESAMQDAGLPIDDQRTTFKRSKTKIPHNKFIVRLVGGRPVEVWTGSTNFTPSGFLGQTNVGHRIADAQTAAAYLKFWELVKTDPDIDAARPDQRLRAGKMVLRGRAVPPEERRLRLLRAHEIPADRSTLRRPAHLLGLGQLLAALAHGKRREHAADPRRHARRRHLHDRIRPHLPPFLFSQRGQRD